MAYISEKRLSMDSYIMPVITIGPLIFFYGFSFKKFRTEEGKKVFFLSNLKNIWIGGKKSKNEKDCIFYCVTLQKRQKNNFY